MNTYNELDVVILKDGRKVTLLDFLGDEDDCIYEDDKNETFFGKVSDIIKKSIRSYHPLHSSLNTSPSHIRCPLLAIRLNPFSCILSANHF